MQRKLSISPFYISLALVMSLLAIFVGFVLLNLFNGLKVATEVNEKYLESSTPRISDDLEKAYQSSLDRKQMPLD